MRRWLLLLLVPVLSLAALSLGTPAVPVSAASTTPPTTAATLQTSPPLERDLSDCISAVPQPGCGFKPQQPGDRGGWLQWTLFGLMLTGIAFIGWRVVRGIRRTAPRDA